MENALTRGSHRSSDRRTAIAAALAVGFVTHTAIAAQTRFVGSHPIAERAGGGYCYVEAQHLHNYSPDHPIFYRSSSTGFAFIGDPIPFGYSGERHIFYGHHPIALSIDEREFCFIDGPHYHAFAPTSGDDYDVVNGIAFYVGPFPSTYVDERAKRWKPLNDELLPFFRFRPVVSVVVPPPEWRGRIYIAPGVKVTIPQRTKHVRRTRVHVEVHE